MDDYEGARGVPRVPRRPSHGPPVYQAPMYGAYDGRMGNQYPPPPQAPGGHNAYMMQQPFHQQQLPQHHQQHPNYPQRNVRDWDSQPDFGGDRQDFKRRRYPEPFQAPQTAIGAPHAMGQPSIGMYQQPQLPGVAPPYAPMGMPQHDMGPHHDMSSMPGHAPPMPMRQNSFSYPQGQPPSTLAGPPQNAPNLNDSYHNLPPPPRRDRIPRAPDTQAPGQLDVKAPTTGSSSGSPGRSTTNPNEPMSFKDYLAKQPDSISPQAAQDGYTAYLQEFTRRQPNSFFDMHKDEEWFRERYDPQYVCDRVKRIEVEVSDRAVEFKEIWEKGGSEVCAPCLTLPPKEPRRGPSNDKSECESPGKVIEIVEDRKGDPKALEEVVKAEDVDMPDTSAVQVDEAKLALASVTIEQPSKTEDEHKAEAVQEPETLDAKATDDGATDEAKNDETKEVEAKEDESIAEVKVESITEAKVDPVLPVSEDTSMKDTSDGADDVLSSDVAKEGSSEELGEETKQVKEDKAVVAEKQEALLDAEEKDPSEPVLKDDSKNSSLPSVAHVDEDKAVVAEEQEALVDAEEKDPSKNVLKDDSKKSTSPSVAHVDDDVRSGKELKKESHTRNGLCLPLRRQHQKDTIFMRGIPRNLSRAALVKTLRHGPDGKEHFTLRRLKLGDINPIRDLQRFGWAVYDSEDTAKRAIEIVRGSLVKSSDVVDEEKDNDKDSVFAKVEKAKDDDPEALYTIDCMLNMERRRKFSEGRTLPGPFADPIRVKRDANQAVQIMRHLDKLRKIDPALNSLTDELLDSLSSDESRLDHVISYLREVHYFCYYSGNEFLEDPTSMPPQEMRPGYSANRVSKHSEADARMVRRVDERAKWVLERDYDRPRSNGDNGVAARAEHLKAWLEANTSDEGNGRFRCRLPPFKLFKGPAFVHKHIRTKHPEKVKEILEKADLETYRANFENDASKAEVISIFNQGISRTAAEETENAGEIRGDIAAASGLGMMSNVGAGYPQAGANMGMYRAPFMGMGMQFPLMMMPQAGATGFAPGYGAAAPFQGGGMGFSGQGMGMPGMVPMQGNGGYRGRGGRGTGRDGGRRGGRNWGRGGSPYGNGRHPDDARDRDGPRRAPQQPLPVDPRSKGRRYNDLDAPSDGPGIDLVRYDDI